MNDVINFGGLPNYIAGKDRVKTGGQIYTVVIFGVKSVVKSFIYLFIAFKLFFYLLFLLSYGVWHCLSSYANFTTFLFTDSCH